ncbi:MAG: Ldh family oxidoreductase [Candidatus Thorarchaeota archaeon]|jgi:LDH2 family malate/lactate/ureidoglycolate dehydrogenase
MTMTLIHHEKLLDFVQRVMIRMQVPKDGAFYIADNLVKSNLRGIDSHGVGRVWRYVTGIREGYIIPDSEPTIAKDSLVIGNVDARNGPGQVAGVFGMNLALEKAREIGLGVVTVFNSNHYGFAGYYAMMALEHDLIGISLTNSEPLVVPTFGKNAMLGTNPIALCAPTLRNRPWVMDLATSVVPSGKLEVYDRLDQDIPDGWATNEDGRGTNNPGEVLRNLYEGSGRGGILPLGGEGELHSGHKGYGLATMVEILSGILSGSNFGRALNYFKDGKYVFPSVGHFFMVIDPSYFIELTTFKGRMDELIDELKGSEKAEGQSRVFVHGEKEYEEHKRREENGIPLDEKTTESLVGFSIEFDEEIEFL